MFCRIFIYVLVKSLSFRHIYYIHLLFLPQSQSIYSTINILNIIPVFLRREVIVVVIVVVFLALQPIVFVFPQPGRGL